MKKRKARRITVPVPAFQQSGYGYQVPPEFNFVLIYFNQKGYSQHALKFYKQFQELNWKTLSGAPIRNWKVAATEWIYDFEQSSKLQLRIIENHI